MSFSIINEKQRRLKKIGDFKYSEMGLRTLKPGILCFECLYTVKVPDEDEFLTYVKKPLKKLVSGYYNHSIVVVEMNNFHRWLGIEITVNTGIPMTQGDRIKYVDNPDGPVVEMMTAIEGKLVELYDNYNPQERPWHCGDFIFGKKDENN